MILIRNLQRHEFHLVDISPWPFFTSGAVLSLTLSLAQWFHGLTLQFSFIVLIIIIFQWFRDIIREGTYEGKHLGVVQQGFRFGVFLFIISEILFFGFFWAFFHSALAPNVEVGGFWPPKDILTFNPWEIPFLNTLILLLSGSFITWTHHSLLIGKYYQSLSSLFLTIILAVTFMYFQTLEYRQAEFCFSDGIYGATFFITTGFHAFHVFIGTLFLFVNFLRLINYHFTNQHHFGLEAAIWYWHMVGIITQPLSKINTNFIIEVKWY
nr:Cox3 [Porphyridium purpureum]UBY46124.1 Cox3 [Porphyridium purpureum]